MPAVALGLLALSGLFSVITGKPPLGISKKDYSEESLSRFARPGGLLTIVMSAGVLAFIFGKTDVLRIGGIVAGIVGVVCYVICMKKMLVKVNV